MAATLLTLSGALAMAYLAIGLFFLKFFGRTRDRLFLGFSVAFLLLAFQRLVLGLAREWSEDVVWLYGLRLLAFLIILVAILDKNRSASEHR